MELFGDKKKSFSFVLTHTPELCKMQTSKGTPPLNPQMLRGKKSHSIFTENVDEGEYIMEKTNMIHTDKSIRRPYDSKDCMPVKKGQIPFTGCRHDRMAYVDKDFGRGNCPLSTLKDLM